MYNQNEVDENMARLFNLEITEKQSEKSTRGPYKKKASTRGGKREGSGRPKGSTNKITPQDMLIDFEKRAGMSFHEFINEQIVQAHNMGNTELVSKYLLGFAKYLVQDIQEIKQDITSNGQTIGASFTFPTMELTDWQNEQPTKH